LDRYCLQKPTDASGLHLFGLICERLGLYDLSMDLQSKAIGILDAQYNQNEDFETEKRFCMAHVSLGRIKLAMHDAVGALEAFEVALSLLAQNSEDKVIQLLRTQAQLGVGLASYKLDDLEKALATFEAASQETPEDLRDVRDHVVLLLSQTLWAIGSEEGREMAKSQLLTWYVQTYVL
jgi:superkiller protein 3